MGRWKNSPNRSCVSAADILIPTGIDLARDIIVANSEVVIALGGGSGTLNEVSAAWKTGRLIIAYENVEGWSAKL